MAATGKTRLGAHGGSLSMRRLNPLIPELEHPRSPGNKEINQGMKIPANRKKKVW